MIPSPSIGDVIAICQIVTKIGCVICETRETPKDYAELESELNSFYETLQEIKKLFELSSIANFPVIAVPLEKRIAECTSIRDEFLGKNAPPRKWYQKIVWVLREPGRAESLRRILVVQRQNLGLLLQQFHCLLGTVHYQGLRNELCEIRAEIQQLPFRARGITLQDAVGEWHEIPPAFCATYEMLVQLIHFYYEKHPQSMPGRELVKRRQYELVYGERNNIVEATSWQMIMSPGLIVKMSMIFRRRGEWKSKCPRCGSGLDREINDGWTACTGCDGLVQVNNQIAKKGDIGEDERRDNESVAREDATNTRDDTTRMQEAVPSQGPDRSRYESNWKRGGGEWSHFRLISILMLWKNTMIYFEIVKASSNVVPPYVRRNRILVQYCRELVKLYNGQENVAERDMNDALVFKALKEVKGVIDLIAEFKKLEWKVMEPKNIPIITTAVSKAQASLKAALTNYDIATANSLDPAMSMATSEDELGVHSLKVKWSSRPAVKNEVKKIAVNLVVDGISNDVIHVPETTKVSALIWRQNQMKYGSHYVGATMKRADGEDKEVNVADTVGDIVGGAQSLTLNLVQKSS